MTPLILQANGISARARTEYYDMAMGGVKANGNNAPAIQGFQKSIYDLYDPLKGSAKFTFSSELTSDNKTVNITVKTDAVLDIPSDVKLHIMVTEKRIQWSNVWPEGVTDGTTSNGQSDMVDVIWDIIGDTLGNDFPAISSGESHSMTHPFTLYDDMSQNPDSIEVTAIMQVVSTKEILAAGRMDGSPFNSTPISSKLLKSGYNKLKIKNIGNQRISFNLPFKNVKASIYNSLGKKLSNTSFKGDKGAKASIMLPANKGVFILNLKSESGECLTQSIILK